MATLRELIIKISANSQSFQSEIQRASRMGSEYYRTLQSGGLTPAILQGPVIFTAHTGRPLDLRRE